jgi:hypothetical protein
MNTIINTIVTTAADAAHLEATLAIGDVTTCQFGNPGDTSWDEATHGNQEVSIIDILNCEVTGRPYYLVKKVGQDYVGRASVPRAPRGEFGEAKLGTLYCTNARTFGALAKDWTGISTLDQAKHSLGF